MPELPEVETVARGVDARVRGRIIASVWLGDKPEPMKSTPREIAAVLTGATVEQVRRVGKHIVFDLVRPATGRGQWLVHLGMTGRLLVSQPEVPIPAHTHAIATLDDGREIRFVDSRRFGRLAVLDLGSAQPDAEPSVRASDAPPQRFTGPGQEPLEISPKAFCELFRGRRTPIKSALLNQKLLHGVGNIYADESLFRAGIRPRRMAGRLTHAELLRLRSALRAVLRQAIRLGGSSVSDYVDADGARGFFQLEHKVYLRGGQPCLVCGTPIRRLIVGGRGTHYCPHCQK